ncbi:MAG TPA: hypothetical protein VFB41_03680 [Solirubrobacteraceae bacterium]|nr:hypothetical protein [Solirubrobacteraceae bacterium]
MLARLGSRLATGPLGHLYSWLADVTQLLARHRRRRLRRPRRRRSR